MTSLGICEPTVTINCVINENMSFEKKSSKF